MVKFGAMALITEAQLNMANLNEEPVWEEGIYQFETTDPVEGGPEGIDNKPTRQLANRTAYLKEEQGKIKEEILLLNQEWSENANYSIGHDAVRNGLRYIALLASGPDNGGAVTPNFETPQTAWGVVLPTSHTIRTPNVWTKIATVIPDDSVFISVFDGSDINSGIRFSADIAIGVRNSVAVSIKAKTLGDGNPEFYTRPADATGRFELWIKRTSSYSGAITIVQNSLQKFSLTKVGILETSSTAPTDITLVPYIEPNVPIMLGTYSIISTQAITFDSISSYDEIIVEVTTTARSFTGKKFVRAKVNEIIGGNLLVYGATEGTTSSYATIGLANITATSANLQIFVSGSGWTARLDKIWGVKHNAY